MTWTVATLAEATQGKILSGDPATPIETISTDTRKIAPGHCFIALAGENRDGHAFVTDAAQKGAGAVIVSKWPADSRPEELGAAVIKVRDTLFALGEIARVHRSRFAIPVIAVSGSNGKTSTKEMIAAILEQKKRILKNKGNFNNLIGLPLTLLELDDQHEAAIVEMGINVPGEMARLAEIGRPTIGVITNVHPAHLEGLHSLDRIMEEKGKLWESLGPDGVAVVNLDDPRLSAFSRSLPCRKITCSLEDGGADVHPSSPIRITEGVTAFRIRFGDAEVPVVLPAMGLHHARNALAAVAAALAAGASPGQIEAGLAEYEPVGQRMQFHRLSNGCVLIDDTYNANPGSVLAAVEAVIAARSGKPFIVVVGEMRELGPESPKLHFSVGEKIGRGNPRLLVTLGRMGLEVEKGAQAAGMDASRCFHAGTHDEAIEFVRHNLPEGAWVLVKGSRAMTMERIVEGIAGTWL